MNKKIHQDFIYEPAPRLAQYLSMSVLLVLSLPLLWQLPLAIMLFFNMLWIARVAIIFFKITPLKNWQILLLMLISIILVLMQLKNIMGRDAGIALLILMVLLKSYEGQYIRDWQVLLIGTLFLTAGSLLFNQDILTALWTGLSLFLVLVCINILDHGGIGVACRQTAKGLLLTLPIMLIFFVAFPRFSEPLWRIPQVNQSQSASGLSDFMQPGSISNLILQNELAFNVIFNDVYQSQVEPMYWRTLILSNFDGRAWRAGNIRFTHVEKLKSDQPAIQYELLVTDWKGSIPALDYPLSVDKQGVIVNGSLVRAKRSMQQLRRIVLSSQQSSSTYESIDKHQYHYYTRLPENINLETRLFAQRLFKDSRSDEEYIDKVLHYFTQEQFVYTLQPPLLNVTEHEIDEFLFRSKQGFCEHYASATAFMLRAVGIPARVVVGYLGGEYNQQAQFWQVRSKDAHAWVEAWQKDKQIWRRIDPTAVIAEVRMNNGIESILSHQELSSIQKVPNWMNRFSIQAQFYWQNWIVNYDAEKQDELFKWLGFAKVGIISVFSFIMIGLLLALLPLLVWWRVQLNKQKNPLQEGFLLIKERWVSDPDLLIAMGPLELKNYLLQQQVLTTELENLIDFYIKYRFQESRFVRSRLYWKWLHQVRKVISRK